MAKRFTDTDKWKKPFIRGLQGAYKLLWLYLLDDCDHAGIWQVDLEVAQVRLGEKLILKEALEIFKDKIVVFDNGEKWFIPDFIDFQYSELNPDNRAHSSVISLLSKYNLIVKNKPLTSPLQGAMDKDKDKDKDKDIVKEGKSDKFSPPTVEQFKEYFVENGFSAELGERAWKGYSEAGWKDSSGKPVKIWKSKCQHVWFTDKNNEHRIQTTHQPTPDAEALERVARYEANRRRPQPLFGN